MTLRAVLPGTGGAGGLDSVALTGPPEFTITGSPGARIDFQFASPILVAHGGTGMGSFAPSSLIQAGLTSTAKFQSIPLSNLSSDFLSGAGGFKQPLAANALTGTKLVAGTALIEPLSFTAGTDLTTAAAGAAEFDGTVLKFTAAASSRQVVVAPQLAILNADFTLANVATAQPWLPAANDTLTVQASTTYEFEATIVIEGMGVVTRTIGILFEGTATFTGIGYDSRIASAAANAIGTAAVFKWSNSATNQVITITSAQAASTIKLRGVMRINGGGTLIPKLQFSADPTGTILCKTNSFFRLWPVGSDVFAASGNWA